MLSRFLRPVRPQLKPDIAQGVECLLNGDPFTVVVCSQNAQRSTKISDQGWGGFPTCRWWRIGNSMISPLTSTVKWDKYCCYGCRQANRTRRVAQCGACHSEEPASTVGLNARGVAAEHRKWFAITNYVKAIS